MAGRKLARYTTTPDETGRMVTYPAGATLPAQVADQVTNEKAWEPEPDGDEPASDAKPATKKAPASKRSSSK